MLNFAGIIVCFQAFSAKRPWLFIVICRCSVDGLQFMSFLTVSQSFQDDGEGDYERLCAVESCLWLKRLTIPARIKPGIARLAGHNLPN